VLRGKALTPFAFPPSVDQLLGLTGGAGDKTTDDKGLLKGPPFAAGRTPAAAGGKDKDRPPDVYPTANP